MALEQGCAKNGNFGAIVAKLAPWGATESNYHAKEANNQHKFGIIGKLMKFDNFCMWGPSKSKRGQGLKIEK